MFPEKIKHLAQEAPDQTILVDQNGTRRTSRRQLDLLADRMASRLVRMNAPRGSFVVLCMGRRMEYIAAWLGILRAGYAVIPTVPDYPQERIDCIVRESGAILVLREDFLEGIEEEAALSEPRTPGPEETAAMVYTSGSTGTPKGVFYDMRAIDDGIERTLALYEGVSPMITASSVTFSFVMFVTDVLLPLAMGAEVHLLDEETRRDVRLMRAYYEEHGITCGVINPGMLRLFGHTSALQRVLAGGQTVSRIFSEEHDTLCVYGLTEAMGCVSAFLVDKPYPASPIGKPVEGIVVELLDEDGQPVPDGQDGEITVTGYLSRGYYGRPEETARVFRFLPDGRVRFSTGDIARRDEHGQLVYRNRKDYMVKINGQRVEPGEIEATATGLDGVEACVVKAFEENGKNYLCAYLVTSGGVKAEDIRRQLRKKLPEYMVPAFFVEMSRIPTNMNGKPDRAGLMPPRQLTRRARYAAPRGETEKKICGELAASLGLDRVGRDDRFFDLGADSLTLMELLVALDAPGLTVADLAECHTPRALAGRMAQLRKQDRADDAACRRKEYPLTSYQLHYFHYMQAAPGVLLGNLPIRLTFPKGKYTAGQLQKAVWQVLRSHPVYGTVLRQGADGTILQHSDPDRIPLPAIHEVSRRELERLLPELVQPFDLMAGPLYRCGIYVTETGLTVFLDTHHIISDKSSVDLVVGDIIRTLKGEPCPEDLYYSYLDSLRFRAADLEEASAFYDSYELLPHPDEQGFGIASDTVTADCGMTVSQFRERFASPEVSVANLLIAVSLRTMAEYNGNPRVAVGTIYSGRTSREKAAMAGLLISEIPIALDVSECPSNAALALAVREKLYAGTRLADLSPGTLRSRPVADDLLTVNYIPCGGQDPAEQDGAECAPVPYRTKAKSCAFYVILSEDGPDQPARIFFRYNCTIYRRESVQRFVRLFFRHLGLEKYTLL